MDFIKQKPTFLSIIAVILIIIGIPFGLYCLTLKGGESLYAILVFGIVIFILFLFIIDRILVSFFDNKSLSIIEFLISIFCLLIYFLTED